jgi:ribonuclease HII
MASLLSYFQNVEIEAGCDEAGRGCLAGPVFAAAVILSNEFEIKGLNDSKQLSEKERNLLAPEIKEKALAWAVSAIDESVVDKINILNASILGMNEALAALSVTPKFVIVDGNRFYTKQEFKHKCIIKGDSLYQSIAAASILAKTSRDEYMRKLHLEYPQYGWDKNMGYGTLFHRKALAEFGPSPYHRKSFHLKNQLSLF